MLSKGEEDNKPKAKEAQTVKFLGLPIAETDRSWWISAREANCAALERPDEAFSGVLACYTKNQTTEESVIAGMSCVPEELMLRDILLHQLRTSNRLKYDLGTYESAQGRVVRPWPLAASSSSLQSRIFSLERES